MLKLSLHDRQCLSSASSEGMKLSRNDNATDTPLKVQDLDDGGGGGGMSRKESICCMFSNDRNLVLGFESGIVLICSLPKLKVTNRCNSPSRPCRLALNSNSR